MSAPAPKKTAPKAKKKTAAPRTPQQRAEDHQERFEDLRARARDFGLTATGEPVLGEPYVLALPDGGEPAVFQRPAGLRDRVMLTRLVTNFQRLVNERQLDLAAAMLPDILPLLSNATTFDRILWALDSQPDGDALLIALAIKVIEHFSERGAGGVPGGTSAS